MYIKFHGGDEEAGEVFIVETKADAGYMLGSHTHKHAHTSILVSGIADVTIDGETTRYMGYQVLQVPANTTHQVEAVTDILWLCIWNSNLAPIEEAEQSLNLVRRDYNVDD